MADHTYTLALQDISLKRFRLRYSTANDCYYLHYDQSVCPPLARITGLAKGAMNVTGLTRYTDQESKMSYIGLSDGELKGEIEWKLDFSHSGLAVKKMFLKAGSVVEEEEGTQITHVITGDGKKVTNSLHFGSKTAEVYQMCGHSVISIKTILSRTSKDAALHFLPEGDGDTCPLDVTVELMVPRNVDEYVGEILLGLKYAPQKLHDGSDAPSESSNDLFQLHVHIVEGAGICNQDTHQPFNAFVKCAVLPESEHSCSPKQTSPRNNVYPTWTKEFVFPGLSWATLSEGALEVILYDHHRLHSSVNIGGIRLCVPRMKESVLSQNSFKKNESVVLFGHPKINGGSPRPLSMDFSLSTDGSPKHNLSRSISSSSSHMNTMCTLSPPSNSPLFLRRDISLASSFPQLSLAVSQNSTSISPLASPLTSPRSSPRTSPKNSPKASPLPSRKSPIAFLKNLAISGSRPTTPENDTDYVHWWMDSALTEVHHWKDVLGREREWVYCWHLLRPKLQPASTN